MLTVWKPLLQMLQRAHIWCTLHLLVQNLCWLCLAGWLNHNLSFLYICTIYLKPILTNNRSPCERGSILNKAETEAHPFCFEPWSLWRPKRLWVGWCCTAVHDGSIPSQPTNTVGFQLNPVCIPLGQWFCDRWLKLVGPSIGFNAKSSTMSWAMVRNHTSCCTVLWGALALVTGSGFTMPLYR